MTRNAATEYVDLLKTASAKIGNLATRNMRRLNQELFPLDSAGRFVGQIVIDSGYIRDRQKASGHIVQ